VREMDERNIAKCWALSWEESAAIHPLYEHLPIEDILDAYEKFPDRFVPFYAPDPSAPGALDRLDEMIARGVRGVGELKVSLRWESDDVGRLLARAAELKMPLVFHMERAEAIYWPVGAAQKLLEAMLNTRALFGVTGKLLRGIERFCGPLKRAHERIVIDFPGYLLDFASLERRLAEFPEITFVGHGPLFWHGISADLSGSAYPTEPVTDPGVTCRLLDEYDNLHADLSAKSGYNALMRAPELMKDLLERHHRKILFGTDNVNLGLMESLLSLGLSRSAMECILGANAERICGG